MKDAHNIAIEVLADALMVHSAQINTTTALGHTPQWDSLAHMRLILAIEEQTGRFLPPEAIVSIANIDDVTAIFAQNNS